MIGAAVGAGVSAISSVVSAAQRMKTAKEQEKKAEELRKKKVAAQKIQSEYTDVANKAQLMALAGIPGLDTAKSNLDNSQANAVRDIRESGKTGSDRLSAITDVEGSKMKTLADLDVKDAEFRNNQQVVANNEQKNVAVQKDARRAEALAFEADLRRQADNLEVAATANKQNAIDDIASTVASTAGTLAPMVGGRDKVRDTTREARTGEPLSLSVAAISPMIANKNATINPLTERNPASLDIAESTSLNPNIDYSTSDAETIKNAQLILQKQGLYTGAIDGIWGPKSKAALELYKTK